MDLNKPIWQLTVNEFLSILDDKIDSKIEEVSVTTPEEKKEFIYGLAGLAKLLGVSKTHASRLKSKGIFDEAIHQNGRS